MMLAEARVIDDGSMVFLFVIFASGCGHSLAAVHGESVYTAQVPTKHRRHDGVVSPNTRSASNAAVYIYDDTLYYRVYIVVLIVHIHISHISYFIHT